MRNVKRIAPILLVLAIACGSTPLATMQQIYASVLEGSNQLFEYELANRARLEQQWPGTRAKVDVLRTRAKQVIPAMEDVMAAYKANLPSGNPDAMIAAGRSLLHDVNVILLQIGQTPKAKG